MLLLLVLRIEGGRRVRGFSGGGIALSWPEVRGRRYSCVGTVRGGAGKYRTEGISETRLMVALGANCVSSSRVSVGVVVVVGAVVAVLGVGFMLALFSDTRGGLVAEADECGNVSRQLSVLTNIERVRLLSREREWLGRDLEVLRRDPRASIKTTVGRVRGSMKVTSFAT
jgi:hypothetical protein